MKILITAGNTLVPIDRVRAITNIFTGRTGATLAFAAHDHGHDVVLLTSHPETAAQVRSPFPTDRWQLLHYSTFDDLQSLMETQIRHGNFDAIIHCAAVSDYRAVGIYAPSEDTHFDAATNEWQGQHRLIDRQAGKVKSDESELWIRLERTPKLVDFIRTTWGFTGILVKFKLEVGVSETTLLQIAERSRAGSQADLMVANTLEGAHDWAYIGSGPDTYLRIERSHLASELIARITQFATEK